MTAKLPLYIQMGMLSREKNKIVHFVLDKSENRCIIVITLLPMVYIYKPPNISPYCNIITQNCNIITKSKKVRLPFYRPLAVLGHKVLKNNGNYSGRGKKS